MFSFRSMIKLIVRLPPSAWRGRQHSLAAYLNPSLTLPERAVAQVEGWILGVA
jgi:hypothetical protein